MKASFFKIKHAAAVLAVLLCALPVCSCDSLYMKYRENPETGTTAEALQTRDLSTLPYAETEFGKSPSEIEVDYSDPEKASAGLRAADYSSTSCFVLAAEEATNTLFADENEPFYSEFSKRNKYVSDYYNNSFVYSEMSLADIKTAITKSKKSGDTLDYVADIIEIPAKDAAKLQTAGLLLSLRSLPFYTVKTDGISGAGVYNTTQVYFETSRTTDGYAAYECLYFNTELFAESTVSSLYNKALNGNFTFEDFLTALQEAEIKDDSYAISMQSSLGHIGEIAFVRSGYEYTKVSSGYPQINSELTSTGILDTLISSLTKNKILAGADGTDSSDVSSSGSSQDDTDAMSVFASGRSLFYIGAVSDLVSLSSSEAKWGILPLPSCDGSVPNIEANRSVICVPVTATRLEFTADMLTALDVFSTDWIGKSFAKTAICNYLRDAASYYTLLGIVENRSYCDFSYMYGTNVSNLANATYLAVEKCATDGTSVATTVAKYKTAVNTAIKKLK